MSPRLFWTLMALAVAGLVAALVMAAVAGNDGKPSDTRCVHIGNNPCVPVKK